VSAGKHAHGWEHYLARLAVTAAGGDPGRDPWLDGAMCPVGRVPVPATGTRPSSPFAGSRRDTLARVRRVAATRYVTPLREGGSLPALVEADDDGLYVLKFRGAGQGPKALVAEAVVGELARQLGFPVPELALVELDATIGRAEPDPEIQDLLLGSDGLNLGVDFLPGSLPFSPAAGPPPEPDFAADVVWLDALVTNVDRTAQNPNLLWWHGRLWLIDHGAALYFHHAGDVSPDHARARFEAVRDHVLLPYASSLVDADRRLAGRVTDEVLERAVAEAPPEWLGPAAPGMYVDYLRRRLAAPRGFVEEAETARG
jgi:HipA-like kinase